MVQDVLMIESAEQAEMVLKPLRINMLREMVEPRTCTDLARRFGVSPQKAYYHVKTLERAGVVERTAERAVNGLTEGFYQARARSFWMSPSLVKSLGGSRAVQDQTSLSRLAAHAEQALGEVGHLADRAVGGEEIPSLSLSVTIELPSAECRAEFMHDLTRTFENLARRYTDSDPGATTADDRFRFTLLCYPQSDEEAA